MVIEHIRSHGYLRADRKLEVKNEKNARNVRNSDLSIMENYASKM